VEITVEEWNAAIKRKIGFASLTFGKVMSSLGKTPGFCFSSTTQDQLIYSGSLIQTGGGALILDQMNAQENPVLYEEVLMLNMIGYGVFAFSLLQDIEDNILLIRQALSSNLRDVVGALIFLTDRGTWESPGSWIGTMMLATGHFVQALGRNRQLESGAALNEVNSWITAGSWIETGGAFALLLQSLADSR
jgi:hypothetical protein